MSPMQRTTTTTSLSPRVPRIRTNRERTVTRRASPPPARIRVALDPLLADLAPMYLEETNRAAKQMAQCVALDGSIDLKTMCSIAHKFKGTGAAYGFAPITHACARIQRACLRDDLDGARDGLAALLDYLSRVDLEPGLPQT